MRLLLLLMLPVLPLPAVGLHDFRENGRDGLQDGAGRVLVSAAYPDIGRGHTKKRRKAGKSNLSSASGKKPCRRYRRPGPGGGRCL